MSLDLSKGQSLDLSKDKLLGSTVMIGCGWDIVGGEKFDLDLSCFGCVGGKAKAEKLVYFKNLQIPGVTHSGDNRTGAGDGDDEMITVDFAKVDSSIDELRFIVNIFNAGGKTFKDVQNEFVRIVDKSNDKQIAKFEIGDSSGVSMHFCTLKRKGDGWAFVAVGEKLRGSDLNEILNDWS